MKYYLLLNVEGFYRGVEHSNLFLCLSAQVGVRNAHSDPFSRLSAQVEVRNAHSNPFSRLSAQVNQKIALPVVRGGAIYDLKQKNEASASSEKPI